MYLYVELWKVKPAWVALTKAERKAKLDELMREAQLNPITGVIPVSVREIGNIVMFDGVKETPAVISDDVARPTGFRYIAAYMIPTIELIKKFEQRVENLGWWFDYFDQQNAWGVMGIEQAVSDMLNAGGKDSDGCDSGGPTKPDSDKPGLLARIKATEVGLSELKGDVKKILSILKKND